MKIRQLVRFLLILPIVVASCAPKGPPPEELVKSRFLEFHRVFKAKDWAKAKPLLSKEHLAEMFAPDSAAKLELAVALTPGEVEVLGVEVAGETAKLSVRGKNDGQEMKGVVRMAKEDGVWKIAHEEWTMEMGSLSAGGESPGTAFLVDPKEKPKVYRVLEGHQDAVSELAYTKDGRYLISASSGDFSLRVWDPESGAMLAEAKSEDRIEDLDVAPDGTIVTADAYKHILAWKWNGATLAVDRTIVGDGGTAAAISRDGKTLATTGFGTSTRLFSIDGTPGSVLGAPANQRCIAFLPGGTHVVSAGDGNRYSVTPTGTGGALSWLADLVTRNTKKISEVSKDSGVLDLDVSADGKWLATAHGDSSLVIFDLSRRKELWNFFVRDSPAVCLRFSPDGKLLATANNDKRVYVWETATGRGVATLLGHHEAPTALVWSPDGRTLAVGDAERKILLWRCGLPDGAGVSVSAAAPAVPDPAVPDTVSENGHANLVRNPRAAQGVSFWMRDGDAKAVSAGDGDPCFELRYGGSLHQIVLLPAGSDGKTVLLVAWASSQRYEENGDQTGLPYLYGNTVDRADDHHYFGYINDATMTLRGRKADEWGTIWGLETVPAGCGAVRFQLEQADGRLAQNGSAARFDDVGVYLFDSEAEAQSFLGEWERSRTQRPIAAAASPIGP